MKHVRRQEAAGVGAHNIHRKEVCSDTGQTAHDQPDQLKSFSRKSDLFSPFSYRSRCKWLVIIGLTQRLFKQKSGIVIGIDFYDIF